MKSKIYNLFGFVVLMFVESCSGYVPENVEGGKSGALTRSREKAVVEDALTSQVDSGVPDTFVRLNVDSHVVSDARLSIDTQTMSDTLAYGPSPCADLSKHPECTSACGWLQGTNTCFYVVQKTTVGGIGGLCSGTPSWQQPRTSGDISIVEPVGTVLWIADKAHLYEQVGTVSVYLCLATSVSVTF